MSFSSDLAIAVSGSSPIETSNYVRHFLDEVLPAHISGPPSVTKEGQTCHVSATVFMDYVPLGIDFCVDVDQEGRTVVALKHPSQNDVIRFNRVFDRLVSFLQSSNLQVITSHKSNTGPARLIDDDFDFADDDMLMDDEPSWDDRVNSVQADLESNNITLRQEAVQDLARWVATEPKSHAAVAQGFVKFQFESTLLAGKTAPLAEIYPIASALQKMSRGVSSEATDVLSNSQLYAVLNNMKLTELPPLVARELSQALQGLSLWKAYSTGEKSTDKFGSNSTRCTDLDALEELTIEDEDDENSMVEDEQKFSSMSRQSSQKSGGKSPWEKVNTIADFLFGEPAAPEQ